MESEMKYFLFNKESDFRRGYIEDMEIRENGVVPIKASGKKGIFISRLLDTKLTGTDWHRLCLKGKENEQSSFRLSIYAGDYRAFNYLGRETDLEEFILRKDIEIDKKISVFSPWLKKQVVGEDDILLHDVQGRYLFFMLEVYWQHNMEKLYDIQIFFPRKTWLDYLPEIYSREDTNGFLERYLGVFQTIYEDLNSQIKNSAMMFDADSAEGDYLLWLAEWIAAPDIHIWPEDQARKFLRRGLSIYKKRGTKQGMIDMITLYTGEAPYIIENHHVAAFRKDKGKYERMQGLYGNNATKFTVLLREEVVDSRWKKKIVLRLIDSMKPAHMEVNLIFMKPYIFLDQYSYMGVNSVLGRYTGLTLDGHSALSMTVLDNETVNADE